MKAKKRYTEEESGLIKATWHIYETIKGLIGFDFLFGLARLKNLNSQL